mgnify:CR=1 FL=1
MKYAWGSVGSMMIAAVALSGCVVSIEKSPADDTSKSAAPATQGTPDVSQTIPAQDELMKLVNGTMSLFADAIATDVLDNFDAFYNAISDTWKQQITTSDLRANFSEFISKKIDVSLVKTTPPTFSHAPSIDSLGVMTVEGSYPGNKMEVLFKLGYVYEYEAKAWKLLSIKVGVK